MEDQYVSETVLYDLQDQVQHWNVNCAVLQKSISETETRIRENAAENGKSQKKGLRLREQIAGDEKTAAELEAQIISLRGETEEENRQAAAIAEETTPAENALKAAEEQLRTDQHSFQEKQQQVVSAERMLAQAQLEVTCHDDRLGYFAVLCPNVGSWCLTHNFQVLKVNN